jgi:hypothetical protein
MQCPHLLNLPDLPDGLHCLASRTQPSFKPSSDPAVLEDKRVQQEELAARAAEAMDQATIEVARKGVAAQVMRTKSTIFLSRSTQESFAL